MNVLMVLTLASYLFPVEYRKAQFEGRHCYYLCNVYTRLTSILFADDTSCIREGTDLAESESESEMYLVDPHKNCIQSNNGNI